MTEPDDSFRVMQKIKELEGYLQPARQLDMQRISDNSGGGWWITVEKCDSDGDWDYSGKTLEAVLDQVLKYERPPDHPEKSG